VMEGTLDAVADDPTSSQVSAQMRTTRIEDCRPFVWRAIRDEPSAENVP